MRKLLLLLCVVLPNPLKLALYRALGFRIGKNVRIGLSLIWDTQSVEIGDNCSIAHFNQFRGLQRLELRDGVYIFNMNEIAGGSSNPHWSSVFIAEEKVQIMSRHFFDCSGTVVLKAESLIGGRDSQFWSHSRTMADDGTLALTSSPVEVGRGVYVGARCTLVGCTVPDGATVAAGSVVVKRHPPEPCAVLLAGNPAVIKKRYENHPISAPPNAEPAIQ